MASSRTIPTDLDLKEVDHDPPIARTSAPRYLVCGALDRPFLVGVAALLAGPDTGAGCLVRAIPGGADRTGRHRREVRCRRSTSAHGTLARWRGLVPHSTRDAGRAECGGGHDQHRTGCASRSLHDQRRLDRHPVDVRDGPPHSRLRRCLGGAGMAGVRSSAPAVWAYGPARRPDPRTPDRRLASAADRGRSGQLDRHHSDHGCGDRLQLAVQQRPWQRLDHHAEPCDEQHRLEHTHLQGRRRT